jgi:putative transposase
LADTHGLAPGVEQVLNRIIAEHVTAFVQAGRYERTATRHDHRHGTRPRLLATRVGRLQLRVPRVRGGGCPPTGLARDPRREPAFWATGMARVVTGVSPRQGPRITAELCGTRISAMQVSRICQGLDPVVTAGRTRSWAETRYPVLRVDAWRLKIREGGHVRATSGLVVTGVTAEGYREILARAIGDREAPAPWGATLAGLKARGLTGVDWVGSDQL